LSGDRPFKFGGGKPPAGFEGGAKQAQRPSHNPADTQKHARDEGETLVEAAVEETMPDYEVDSAEPKEAGQNHGEGHAQRPTWERSNPWPAAVAVKQKPFKF
jgi:hypothetical protein